MLKNFEYTSKQIFLIALILFCGNQITEFFMLQNLGNSYADLCKWDCLHYKRIVEIGYNPDTTENIKNQLLHFVFFPALPMFASAIQYFTALPADLAVILTSKIFFLLAIYAFTEFVYCYFPKISPILSGFVITFSPYQLYANTGYTESIFLFFTCLSFIFLKQKNYIRSGLCCAFLSASRIHGIFFILPYLLTCLQNFSSSSRSQKISMLCGLLLAPLGISAFMMMSYFKTGDALGLFHLHDTIWGTKVKSPADVLIQNLSHIESKHGYHNFIPYFAATGVVGILISLIWSWKKKYELALFSFSAILFSLSFQVFCMPRYVWWQAPILLFLTHLISLKKYNLAILPIFFFCSIVVEILWLNEQVQFLI